jgi:phosphoribosylglycinamide formyltransferase-1
LEIDTLPGINPIKLAVLVSGGGTTLQNLIDQISAGHLDAEIAIVIASKQDLPALERASQRKLMNFVVDRRAFDDAASHSKAIFKLCDDAGVELVCLAGWLQLLVVPQSYEGRVMNIHPALLPSFGGKGMYGQKVHQAVLDYGCKVGGCTVHFIDTEYDHGPIILQRTCAVLDDDSASTLATRVFEQEKIAYPEAIQLFQQDRLRIADRRVKILAPGASKE